MLWQKRNVAIASTPHCRDLVDLDASAHIRVPNRAWRTFKNVVAQRKQELLSDRERERKKTTTYLINWEGNAAGLERLTDSERWRAFYRRHQTYQKHVIGCLPLCCADTTMYLQLNAFCIHEDVLLWLYLYLCRGEVKSWIWKAENRCLLPRAGSKQISVIEGEVIVNWHHHCVREKWRCKTRFMPREMHRGSWISMETPYFPNLSWVTQWKGGSILFRLQLWYWIYEL